MMVIIINGYPQAGKDTFIAYCAEDIAVNNVSTVDEKEEKGHAKFIG